MVSSPRRCSHPLYSSFINGFGHRHGTSEVPSQVYKLVRVGQRVHEGHISIIVLFSNTNTAIIRFIDSEIGDGGERCCGGVYGACD